MCCKWLSCQWRSHASMARVNTVRCGLFDESVFSTIQKAVSAMIHTSINQFHTIPFCGQMFMNTSTQTVLHPLGRRMEGEQSHVLSTRRQISPKSHHSFSCFIKHTHSTAIRAKVKVSCKKNCRSSFHAKYTQEALSTKPQGNSLLPTSEVQWWAALMGSTNTVQEMRHQPWNLSGRCNQPLKICRRVVLLVVFFNYIVRFCTIKIIMLLGI